MDRNGSYISSVQRCRSWYSSYHTLIDLSIGRAPLAYCAPMDRNGSNINRVRKTLGVNLAGAIGGVVSPDRDVRTLL